MSVYETEQHEVYMKFSTHDQPMFKVCGELWFSNQASWRCVNIDCNGENHYFKRTTNPDSWEWLGSDR